MNKAFIVAAKRTAVVPRGGAFAQIEAAELAAPVFCSLIEATSLTPQDIDHVIMGNALYGGGNPARVASLLAGLPETVPAVSLDTQCCSGMDAIGYAAQIVMTGKADAVLAGGMESFSRSPIRQRRPKIAGEQPLIYTRPPFTPWPKRDPDMLAAAYQLARQENILRAAQEQFAIDSHSKACRSTFLQEKEILPIADAAQDLFTRTLTLQFCARLKPIAGSDAHALTAATTAVEADAAAAVIIVSQEMLAKMEMAGCAVAVLDCVSFGNDPEMPALAPIMATYRALEKNGLKVGDIQVVEIMEAFAAQAMMFLQETGIDPGIVNRGGGGLARGHPIGASGAINIVRLWSELQDEPAGTVGLAAIAAAGGLGTAFLGKAMR